MPSEDAAAGVPQPAGPGDLAPVATRPEFADAGRCVSRGQTHILPKSSIQGGPIFEHPAPARSGDDRFAVPGDKDLTVVAALHSIGQMALSISPVETVSLKAARGRILAEDVSAPFDLPPYDNSAVGGYAVLSADLPASGVVTLPVTGRAAAGHPLGRPAQPGEAIRIFTGAPMPDGLDTVIMQEHCTVQKDGSCLPAGVQAGDYVDFMPMCAATFGQ